MTQRPATTSLYAELSAFFKINSALLIPPCLVALKSRLNSVYHWSQTWNLKFNLNKVKQPLFNLIGNNFAGSSNHLLNGSVPYHMRISSHTRKGRPIRIIGRPTRVRDDFAIPYAYGCPIRVCGTSKTPLGSDLIRRLQLHDS